MELTGLHHVTAVTATAAENVRFYTQTLGLRLVKKTVNQDDVSAYHLFYGDEAGNPGTEVTFFDWPAAGSNRPGTGAISSIALSAPNEEAVEWWSAHLKSSGVETSQVRTENGNSTIYFTDREGQSLQIVGSPAGGHPWEKSPVPVQYGLSGMHHVNLTVRSKDSISQILVAVLGMREALTFESALGPTTVFETAAGGAGATIHVLETKAPHLVRIGAGGVHHVAFRTPNVAEQQQWLDRLRGFRLQVSGMVDRYYFNSIYFREPGGILFEIATDGPGFASDEEMEHLGERLSLPPFLEGRRAAIEAGLTPI